MKLGGSQALEFQQIDIRAGWLDLDCLFRSNELVHVLIQQFNS